MAKTTNRPGDIPLIALVEPLEPLMTPEDVGRALGCTPRTVVRRTKVEGWPHRRVGRSYRYTREDFHTVISRAHRGLA